MCSCACCMRTPRPLPAVRDACLRPCLRRSQASARRPLALPTEPAEPACLEMCSSCHRRRLLRKAQRSPAIFASAGARCPALLLRRDALAASRGRPPARVAAWRGGATSASAAPSRSTSAARPRRCLCCAALGARLRLSDARGASARRQTTVEQTSTTHGDAEMSSVLRVQPDICVALVCLSVDVRYPAR